MLYLLGDMDRTLYVSLNLRWSLMFLKKFNMCKCVYLVVPRLVAMLTTDSSLSGWCKNPRNTREDGCQVPPVLCARATSEVTPAFHLIHNHCFVPSNMSHSHTASPKNFTFVLISHTLNTCQDYGGGWVGWQADPKLFDRCSCHVHECFFSWPRDQENLLE